MTVGAHPRFPPSSYLRRLTTNTIHSASVCLEGRENDGPSRQKVACCSLCKYATCGIDFDELLQLSDLVDVTSPQAFSTQEAIESMQRIFDKDEIKNRRARR